MMAKRTPAEGFADACIEKAAARSASAGKNKIRVNPRNLRLISFVPLRGKNKIRAICEICGWFFSISPW